MSRNDCKATNEAGYQCVFGQGHGGDHNFGLGFVRDLPAPTPEMIEDANRPQTYAITIGDRDFPKWQETIRRAQHAAHKQAAESDTKAAEEKAAKDLLKSEMIGALLVRVGLPAGQQDGDSRRLDDYVFSVDRDNYLRIWINPADMSTGMRDALYDDEWAYRDLSESWGAVYGDGSKPYGLAYHESAEPGKLVDLQVWIADQFDRLEKNYADRVRHIEENKTKDVPTRKAQPTDAEKLVALFQAMIDRALENHGIGI